MDRRNKKISATAKRHNPIHYTLVLVASRCMNRIIRAICVFILIVNIALAQGPVIYTFNTDGNWSNPANWLNNLIPVNPVPAGSTIIINAQCLVDQPQVMLSGANVIVNGGGSLTLPAGLINNNSSTPADGSNFQKYTIAKGSHYCDKNSFGPVNQQELAFIVKFDSSAIYRTVSASNQVDINKLYGFSDNGSHHQMFSARFGWRWTHDSLQIFGYVYNNGILNITRLGTVEIGSENSCSIKVDKATYIFTLNGEKTIMPRASTTVVGQGYKLYPYFGGDEVAPHEISIWIAELPGG